MTGDIIRAPLRQTARGRAGARPLSLPWLWQAFGAGRPSSRPVQPGGFAVALCVLPYTDPDPSLVGIEILVLRNAIEIVAGIASERSGATAADLPKSGEERKFERFS